MTPSEEERLAPASLPHCGHWRLLSCAGQSWSDQGSEGAGEQEAFREMGGADRWAGDCGKGGGPGTWHFCWIQALSVGSTEQFQAALCCSDLCHRFQVDPFGLLVHYPR